MTARISRRSMLLGASRMAAFGTLASLLAQRTGAQVDEESAILLSMLYPNPPGAKFDTTYYRDQHIPLLRSLYGDSIERIELCTPRKPPAAVKGFAASKGHVPSAPTPAMGLRPSVVLAAARIWIRDVKGFAARGSEVQARVDADLRQVTEVTPTVQYDQVVDTRGDARGATKAGDQVYSTWFPTQEGKTFDASYYAEKVIPLMVKLYGTKAIRRVEFSLGAVQGGAQPAQKAEAHYYIRDRAAWDAAGMQAGMQLMAEGPKYTTVVPFVADMVVAAAG